MAVQSPFFGKRDTDSFTSRQTPGNGTSAAQSGTGVHPTGLGSGAPAPSSSTAAGPAAAAESGSKLTVGPNSKLKGVEITDCDTLVVEGTVEATMDSRVIQISEQGAFRGSAEIDIAEIRGEFNGNLTVRQKLVIFSTGKVNGKIRYGKVVIEKGGQLAGEIEVGTGPASAAARPSSSSLPAGPAAALAA
ncbi:bactofilin family protein [Xylophilus sp.]|uniref:bactofilin family protein n=1 Tax=Xylophilus sp. TaxID=2653893 RepID=UPI0013BAE3F2|nr:polymer-forming cytoskeletal protein [Xylophilus sp.]KAF1043955.1 MAG: hypothetical protein GAK38_03752 [Xylophilus sp.]